MYATHKANLRNAAEFDSVFKSGKKWVRKELIFFYTPNNMERSRLGVVVKKRDFKTAVARNRIKRVARETFRQVDLTGCDVVLLIRPTFKGVPNDYQCLKRAFQSLKDKLEPC